MLLIVAAGCLAYREPSLLPARANAIGARPPRRTSSPVCFDKQPTSVLGEGSPLVTTLAVFPVIVGVGAGLPLFAALYLPLFAIGRKAEASPTAVIVLSTLLFLAGSTLFDVPASSLILTTLGNSGIAAVLLSIEVRERTTIELAKSELDDFEKFDRQLDSATKQQK
jgi:hypothetical protein